MKFKYSSTPAYEEIYKNVLKEVGMGRYLYATPEESFVSLLNLNSLKAPFICVCAGTGSTLDVNFAYGDFFIPKKSEIIIERVLRSCNHGGHHHGNADDYLYFPIKSGNIVRVSRRDSPDHIFNLAETAGLGHIASACHLPKLKSGPISHYVESGAALPIRIDCPNDNLAKVIDITKKGKE